MEGHELVVAMTTEHGLIQRFTDNGMTYADIEGFIESSTDNSNSQTSFFEHNSYSD